MLGALGIKGGIDLLIQGWVVHFCEAGAEKRRLAESHHSHMYSTRPMEIGISGKWPGFYKKSKGSINEHFDDIRALAVDQSVFYVQKNPSEFRGHAAT